MLMQLRSILRADCQTRQMRKEAERLGFDCHALNRLVPDLERNKNISFQDEAVRRESIGQAFPTVCAVVDLSRQTWPASLAHQLGKLAGPVLMKTAIEGSARIEQNRMCHSNTHGKAEAAPNEEERRSRVFPGKGSP